MSNLFGEYMSSWRHSQALTTQGMGEKLGIRRQHVHDIEQGNKRASVVRAAAFAQAMGVSPLVLVRLVLQDEVNQLALGVVVELRE